MKYYLIAGEASGDLHGSNLIKALMLEDSSAIFRSWGGDLMKAAGGTLVKHIKDLAFMGFLEVLKNLPTILNNIKFCKSDILDFQPDVLILIDYPGFNLRIAKWAKKKGIKVIYYISPQIWAWHTSRVHGIKKSVDKMLVILPFEKEFYAKYDCEVDFVGHPLLDVVNKLQPAQDFKNVHHLNDKEIIALLPGSRKQEIQKMLQVMLSMVEYFPNYQFVVAGAPSIEKEFYQEIFDSVPYPSKSCFLVQNQTYDLLHHSKAALVTSGTATLETAIFKVPQVVCYKGNSFSFFLAKRLVAVNFISLVNLILDKEIVKELIQTDFNKENLKLELEKILTEKNVAKMKDEYIALQEKLGGSGASKKAANIIHGFIDPANQ